MEQLSRIAIDFAFCPSNGSISGINDPRTKSMNFSPSTVPLVRSNATKPLDASAAIAEIRCGEVDGDTLAALPLIHS